MLEIQFNRWIADTRSLDASDNLTVDLMISLLAVAREMDQLGYFDDDNNVLCHLDLEPRNILLSLEPQVTISGILDWDSAVFAPIFMSCAPPFWLWGWDDEEDEDEKNANDIPPTADLQEIKRTFEDVVGSKILRYTHMAQYRLARRLFQAAISGINSNEAYKESLTLNASGEEWHSWDLRGINSMGSNDGTRMTFLGFARNFETS
jgi:thiamine kinase-like enzyme